MGQQEVVRVLERQRTWTTADLVLSKTRNLNIKSVRRALGTMYKFKEVKRRCIKCPGKTGKTYEYKII